MSKIIIGKANGRNVGFDIAELLPTRLLIQANSGGGKSFLLRRILEQAFGKIQCFVIDPAGEFATLREKYGYVLVGEHGETPIDIRSAGLVAEKLLELRASAVFDLYSLKPELRHEWVKKFLGAMMNAPKKLWHPVLVEVDEAHKFMPEKGEGESVAKSEMLSLCSDGRKYGYCAVLATQRLAKLDKSGASELTNVLIGPTFIDVDLERAHKALGIVRSEWAAFDEQMKTMPPGHFFALGRAISKKRMLVKIGPVETTHPQPGIAHTAEPPPPPEKVRALLPKLADLPQIAEAKARTEADMRREIRELNTKLNAAEGALKRASALTQAKPGAPKSDPNQARMLREFQSLLGDAVKIIAKINAIGFEGAEVKPEDLRAAIEKAAAEVGKIAAQKIALKRRELENLKAEVNRLLTRLNAKLGDEKMQIAVDEPISVRPVQAIAPRPPRTPREISGDGTVRIGNLHQQIAGILAGYYPNPVKIDILATMCRRVVGGSWSARLSECRAAGILMDAAPGHVVATEQAAAQYAGTFQAPQTTREVLDLWEPKMGQLHRDMLKVLVDAGGEPVSVGDLAQAVNRTVGGSFSARISEVRNTGLLVDAGKGYVAANKEALFLPNHAA